MDIERINAVLAKAIVHLQESEVDELIESAYRVPTPAQMQRKFGKLKKQRKFAGMPKGNVLNKLPPGTKLYYPMYFSSWGGDMALVWENDWLFDPEHQLRNYAVRRAITIRDRKPIKADSKYLNKNFNVSDPSKPYEKVTFRMGGSSYHWEPTVEGTFDKVKEYWVKVKLKDLSNDEDNKVQKWLSDNGYIEVGHYPDLKKSDWVKALQMSFTEVQESFPWQKANDFDLFLDRRGVDTSNDREANSAWAAIKGIYALKRDGFLKWVLEP